MKLLVIGGSTSKKSINKQLAVYTANLIPGASLDVIDLNDYEMPIFSVDREETLGHLEKAKLFVQKISDCNGIIISLSEHNGSYSAAFKNVFDWASRAEEKLWQNKPMLLMATSPGARGGASVLEAAKNRFPFMGGNIVATFSLPNFTKNFQADMGISSNEYKEKLEEQLRTFSVHTK